MDESTIPIGGNIVQFLPAGDLWVTVEGIVRKIVYDRPEPEKRVQFIMAKMREYFGEFLHAFKSADVKVTLTRGTYTIQDVQEIANAMNDNLARQHNLFLLDAFTGIHRLILELYEARHELESEKARHSSMGTVMRLADRNVIQPDEIDQEAD